MTIEGYVNCENVYTIEEFQSETTMKKYLKDYVNIPHFLNYCKACKNYNRSWECPPHSINVLDYWNQFNNISIIAVKLNYTKSFQKESRTSKELDYIKNNTLYKERRILRDKLQKLEKEYQGQYLYGGRCDICPECAKIINEPCRFPQLKRYSVESIGADIIKTTKDFFNFELKWIGKDQKIPEYLTVVCAILY